MARIRASGYDSRVMRRASLAALCVLAASALHSSVSAADLPKGMSVVPGHPLYYVARDAYVRELPKNDARRIGQIMKGQPLTVAGKVVSPRSKGPAWLALKRPDGTVGYVFSAALVAMIDGTLKTPLQGKLTAADRPECRYIIAFEDRTQIAGEIQQTAVEEVKRA